MSVQNQRRRVLLVHNLRRRKMQQNLARTTSLGGRSPSGKISRQPSKHRLKGTCTNPSCKKWHSPEFLFYKTKEECKFKEKCSYVHCRVEEQERKRSKRNGNKSAVGYIEGDTAIRLCISRHGAAEIFIDFTEELNHVETNPMCATHQSRVTSC